MGARGVAHGEAQTRIPAFAWGPVGSAMAGLAVALTATSAGYGYHRDELYFRMLPPQWGYVDQPPLTPWLVKALSAVADEVWSIRILATLAAVATSMLVALVARELGGGGFGQGLAAWGYGFAAFPLVFGHVALTTGVDLLAWVGAALFVVRAVTRDEPRWWLAFGAVVGAATWNKLLAAFLVVALAVGFATVGPRRLPWRWVLGGVLIAAALALPALVYQVTHAWPQLTMGRALSARNGAENRVLLAPMLFLLLGPLLVPIWVAGLVSLWRRREVRFLAVSFAALLVLSAVSAGQVYYPLGLLAVVYAAGCVAVERWRHRGLVVATVTVNALVAAVISLPLIPVSVVGGTPVPGINQAARDSVGWPGYVQQVASVYASLSPAERAGAVVVTNNYGEAGAIARYGPALGLPAALSGQNELWFLGRPPT
ncbi:MAG: glycosyltransferase family 39 protein, partial [Lapillicoccus sp.]